VIFSIVEGQGEESAVPVLLRRLRDEAGLWGLEIGKAHRRRRSQFVKKDALQAAVRRAASESSCTGVLVLFDADDDCPKALAPQLEAWTRQAAAPKAGAVVIANREFEAWFLASVEELRGVRGIAKTSSSHPAPESPRDAKGELGKLLVPTAHYLPAADQAALTQKMDLRRVYRTCRSFRRLTKAFGELAAAGGHALPAWPPKAWVG
jgi:hypothetical protein